MISSESKPLPMEVSKYWLVDEISGLESMSYEF